MKVLKLITAGIMMTFLIVMLVMMWDSMGVFS